MRIVRIKHVAVLLAVAATAGLSAPSASAWGYGVYPCQQRTVLPAFSAWSDGADYFRIPNGGFESGGWRWSLWGGASIDSTTNEPWFVFDQPSQSETRVLALPSGSGAASGRLCVGAGEEAVRLFVNRPGVAGASLDVTVTATNPDPPNPSISATVQIDGTDPGWAPSDRIIVPANFGTAGTEILQVRITPSGEPADWQVDDVAVDPWRHCC